MIEPFLVSEVFVIVAVGFDKKSGKKLKQAFSLVVRIYMGHLKIAIDIICSETTCTFFYSRLRHWKISRIYELAYSRQQRRL